MRDEEARNQSVATQNGFAEFKSSEPADESAIIPAIINVTGTYFRETSLEAISLPPAIMALQAKLKTAYTQNSGLKLLLDERHEFALRDLFVDLELITTSKQKEELKKDAGVDRKQDGKRDPTLRREFYKVLEEQRTAIEPEQLFSTLDDNPAPSRVWLEGAAGTGKTTLCRYLAYRWATAEDDKAFWPQFKLVIYLPLREIVDRYDNTQEYDLGAVVLGPWHKLTSFGKDAFGRPLINETDKRSLWEFIQAYPQAVVFLLDGFDEVREPHPAVQALVDYAPCYLLSSRPHLAPTGIQREVETRGFSPEHIRQYAERYFKLIEADEAESQGLLAWLDRNPHLLGLSQVPLNCQMICAAWHSKALAEQPTLTQLYETLMEQWQRRALRRLGKIPEHILKEYSAKDVNAACHSWMQILHELAFRTLRGEASVLISGVWLEEAIEQSLIRQGKTITADEKQNLAKEVLNLGVIVRQNHYARLFDDRYEVIHLTFMEYLVADYLAEGMSQKPESPEFIVAKDSVERYLDAERFNIVWWFMAGRLTTLAPNRLNPFFRLLVTGMIQDPYGFVPNLQLIHCAEEARLYSNTAAESSIIPTAFQEHLLKLVAEWFRWLSPDGLSYGSPNAALSRCLVQTFSMSPNFSQALLMREFNSFAVYLHEANIIKLDKKTFIWIIQYCSTEEIQAYFSCLKELLTHEEGHIRSEALELVKVLVPRLSAGQFEELWSELKKSLAHEEYFVDSSPLELFKVLVSRFSAEQVMEAWSELKKSLAHKGYFSSSFLELFKVLVSRFSAEKCGELWSWIKASLVYEDYRVRSSALRLFAALMPRLSAEQCREVWSWIKKSMAHEKYFVRSSAIWLFEDLVPRLSAEQCKQVWPELKESLAHENDCVRVSVLRLFKVLAPSLSAEQCKEIWPWIKESLVREDFPVRSSALELFKVLEPRLSAEQCSELWPEIKKSLTHKKILVRLYPLEFLNALVSNVFAEQIKEVRPELKKSLDHEESYVPHSALEFLNAFVPRVSAEQIGEVWPELKELLAHERFAAFELFRALVPRLSAEQCKEVWPELKKSLVHEKGDVDVCASDFEKDYVRSLAFELFKVLVPRLSAEQVMDIWAWIKESLAPEKVCVLSRSLELFKVLVPRLSAEYVMEVWSWIKESLADEKGNVRFLVLEFFAALVPRLSAEQCGEVWFWIKGSLIHEKDFIRYAALQIFNRLVPKLAGFIEIDWMLILTSYMDVKNYFSDARLPAQLLKHLSPQSVLIYIDWLQVRYERFMNDLVQQSVFITELMRDLPAFLNYLKTCPPDYKARMQSALYPLFKKLRAPEHDMVCSQLLGDLSHSVSLTDLFKTSRSSTMRIDMTSNLENDLVLRPDNWAVHIARREVSQGGMSTLHVFLIIEGIVSAATTAIPGAERLTAPNAYLFYADLVTDNGTRSIIQTEFVTTPLPVSAEHNLLFRLSSANVFDEYSLLASKSFNISAAQALTLINSIERDRTHYLTVSPPIPYQVMGRGASSPAVSGRSIASSAQGDNCYTWARQKLLDLGDATGDARVRADQDLKTKFSDVLFAAYPPHHLPGHERRSCCVLM